MCCFNLQILETHSYTCQEGGSGLLENVSAQSNKLHSVEFLKIVIFIFTADLLIVLAGF
jgi:hypothetical protein